MLLFHAALSNKVWHVYVDFELFKVLEFQYRMTNMISVITQTDEADIACPYITQGTAQRISFPCAFLQSALLITNDAQLNHVWTVTCPEVLWIELHVITLDLPISGPQCTDGYVAFLNFLGEPPDVKYCGRKPREILYAHLKLSIVMHIQQLRSRLRINLKYQFITQKTQIIHLRMPYVMNCNCKVTTVMFGLCCDEYVISPMLLTKIPHHSSDMTSIVRYHILFAPDYLLGYVFWLAIHAGNCNYVVYDGPGIQSPRKGNSSLHSTIYSVQSTMPMYIEFWGSREICQPVQIEYRTYNIYHDEAIILLSDDTNKPIHCSNTNYRLVHVNYEFHVQSSEQQNVWCRFLPPDDNWNFLLEMEFYGPNNLFHERKASSCQFGGVLISDIQDMFSMEYSRAFCESLSIHNEYYTRNTKSIQIYFLSGYTSGSVKLRIFKTDVLSSSFKWGKRTCRTDACAGNNIHIWHKNSIMVVNDASKSEKTKHVFFDVYSKQYNGLITEPLNVSHLDVHLTAGKEDGSIMLGLVHFVLSLHCSGHSICDTELIIGASMLAPSFTHHVSVYNGSVQIDEHVEYARVISLSVKITHVDKVHLKVIFEKIQHCDHGTFNHQARQLAYNDCNFITVKNTLGSAQFLTQLMHSLTIRLNPECPVKECIDISVEAIPLCGCSEPFEWKNTALEHVPIIVNTSYTVTSLTWTHSAQCSADFHSVQHLCDIWINVGMISLVPSGILRQVVYQSDHLIVTVSSYTHQLYYYKM